MAERKDLSQGQSEEIFNFLSQAFDRRTKAFIMPGDEQQTCMEELDFCDIYYRFRKHPDNNMTASGATAFNVDLMNFLTNLGWQNPSHFDPRHTI